MRGIYGKSWETKLQFISVQDQSTYFWKDINSGIYVVMICRSASFWKWLVGSTLFFLDGQRITEINQGEVGMNVFMEIYQDLGNLNISISIQI